MPPRRRATHDASASRPPAFQGPPAPARALLEVEHGGRRYAGEVVVAAGWSAELGAPPPEGVAFRIVLLTRPADIPKESFSSGRVVVCVPSRDAAPAIAEAAAVYQAAPGVTALPWPPNASALYTGGMVYAGGAPPASAAGLFAPGDVRTVLGRIAALADLEGAGSQVARTRAYLESARPPETDEELHLDRLSLLEQVMNERVAREPGVWPSIAALLEHFKVRYAPAYLRHHRRFQTEVAALRSALDGASHKIRALGLLNGIGELGAPAGEAALTAARGLAERLVPCRTREQDLASLESDPLCPQCRVALDASPPAEQVRGTLAALDAALGVQQRRLSSAVARQVLERNGEPRLKRFLDVVQAANLGAMAQVMNEELAAFIQALLTEEVVEVSAAGLRAELASRFPELSQEETAAYGSAVAQLLDRAFEESRKAHPGKRIRLRVT